MSLWPAGGWVEAEAVVGAADEIGRKAVDAVHPINGLPVAILHLPGLDDRTRACFYQGRFKQPSRTGGAVPGGLLA